MFDFIKEDVEKGVFIDLTDPNNIDIVMYKVSPDIFKKREALHAAIDRLKHELRCDSIVHGVIS